MKYSRRRVLQIVATTSTIAVFPGLARSAIAPRPVTWRGTALGADASITLYHSDRTDAQRLVSACVTEVRRLEGIFSLFDPSSSLSKLNRRGRLVNPPKELGSLLSESQRVGDLTGGAFDVTVQPLWRLFADHFSQANPDPAGPPRSAISAARRLVDYRAIGVSADQIQFLKPGMAVTLNGIAQGYITDRVADLLKAGGVERVLVDMGEVRGVGQHPDGRPWRIGVTNPMEPGAFSRVIELEDRAVASSGSYCTRFGVDGHYHHLFDPGTGSSADFHAGVTVLGQTATLADALSTGFSAMPMDRIRAVIAGLEQVSAIVTGTDGTITAL